MGAAGIETCLGSSSGGLSVMGGGFSFGSTKVDEGCTVRLLSRQLHAFGFQKAAIALMCQDERVAVAMEAAGAPCPAFFEREQRQASNQITGSIPYGREQTGSSVKPPLTATPGRTAAVRRVLWGPRAAKAPSTALSAAAAQPSRHPQLHLPEPVQTAMATRSRRPPGTPAAPCLEPAAPIVTNNKNGASEHSQRLRFRFRHFNDQASRSHRSAELSDALMVLAPPLMRCLAHEALEHGCEIRLRLKADAKRDLDQRHAGFRQQVLGARYPSAKQILARPDARGGAELRREIHAAEAGGAREIRERDALRKMRLDIFECPLEPPFRQRRSLGLQRRIVVGAQIQPARHDSHAGRIGQKLDRFAGLSGREERQPQLLDRGLAPGIAAGGPDT